LLALVPLACGELGVSSSLLKGDEQQTEEFIEHIINQMAPQLEQLPGTEQEKNRGPRERIIQEILSFIANIHSGALGVTGTLALVFVAIGLLSTIEFTFNDIWGVSRGRSWFARLICYWTAITLGPLIVLLAMGLAVSGQLLPARDQPAPAEQEATGLEPAVTTAAHDGENPDLRENAVLPMRLMRTVLEGPLGRCCFRCCRF
jgi:uncharacterized BrkB/YihY/UPF0761 family membrane protein